MTVTEPRGVSYESLVSRNVGLVEPDEQQRISEATILLAGIGAEGGATATCLARLGFRRFRLADIDTFDATNLNRQFGAYADTVGLSKVEGLTLELSRINPGAEIEGVPEGVTVENAERLVRGVDCIVNGIDLFALDAARALDRAARAARIVIVGAASVGFRSDFYAYHPSGMGLGEYVDKTLAAGRFPWIPPNEDLPPSVPVALFDIVRPGEIPAPVVAPTVFLTGARAATAVFELITGRREPVYVPRYSTFDLVEMTADVRECFPEEAASR